MEVRTEMMTALKFHLKLPKQTLKGQLSSQMILKDGEFSFSEDGEFSW